MEKRYGWLIKAFGDIVGLFDTKGKATITVVLIGCLVYLFIENRDLNRSMLEDTRNWQDRERDIYLSIIKRYDPQFNRLIQASDSMRMQVDSTTMTIKPVVERLGKILNDVKQ